MLIYFCGLSGCKLLHGCETKEFGTIKAVDGFIPVSIADLQDIEIGWDYILIWGNHGELYLSGKMTHNNDSKNFYKLLQIPEKKDERFSQAIAGSEHVTVVTKDREIWTYNIYKEKWSKVLNFIPKRENSPTEFVTKIVQGRCTFALTNFGQVFAIPSAITMTNDVKFTDVVCGYDHTIMLADNGDVYSMGIGTRGQLGHCDLEDSDEPKLIEALAGLKVIQIAAGGWHSAAITDQGDLYTWGWNNEGQLGIPNEKNILPIPVAIDVKYEIGSTEEINVVKVQCGSTFTICLTESSKLLGTGSNKYGQLGFCRKTYRNFKRFTELKIDCLGKPIKDLKCKEWSSCVYTL